MNREIKINITESIEKKIGRSNWIKWKFSDLVKNIVEKVTPKKSGLEQYIGLEHLDAESLKIKRFGKTSELKGDKQKIYKGDFIFAKRNAYLKRVAIADFDAVASAHSMVLRAKSENILPEFLPFFLLSEIFWQRAIEISVGSLSPTINWKSLAKQKFLLPPKDQQAKLNKLLWSIEDLIECDWKLLNKAHINIEVKSSELIWKSKFPRKPVKSFATKNINKFVDGDWIESKDQSENGIRLLQLADIGIRKFINKSSRFISKETFERLKCFEVLPGDVLIARMPEPIGRACIIPSNEEKMITAVDCCIARVDPEINSNKFLMLLLNSKDFLHKANQLASGSTRQRIARKALEDIEVPKPKLNSQIKIVNEIENFMNTYHIIEKRITNSQSLKKSIINQIFYGI